MGGIANILAGAEGMVGGTQGTQVGSVNPVPFSMQNPVQPMSATGTLTEGIVPSAPTSSVPTFSAGPVSSTPAGTTVPGVAGPTFDPGTSKGIGKVLGGVFGNDITSLLQSMSPDQANSLAQAIINANAPNVAKGSASLNEQLAASGISPSSSVSAIENADYMAGVQKENVAELAKINLTEQEMQTQLWESLFPGLTKQKQDSSGWNIFSSILQGIGDIFKM